MLLRIGSKRIAVMRGMSDWMSMKSTVLPGAARTSTRDAFDTSATRAMRLDTACVLTSSMGSATSTVRRTVAGRVMRLAAKFACAPAR